MAYESIKIREIIERAVDHTWSIPEFQRGFVWKTTQVRDLAESLWLDYPIGTLLVWNSRGPVEMRTASDAKGPSLWVVDGQQRTTALCILSGRKPYWWGGTSEWEKTLKKYDIRFDVDAREPPFFVTSNAAIKKAKATRYVPVRNLLVLDTNRDADQHALQALAKQVKIDGFCDGMDAMEVYARLDRVRKIRDKDVVTIGVDNELEDVVDIFSRLNSRGTRVREADIYLGIVAARTPGWVRSTFLPYLETLDNAGFRLNPNLLFRTITAVGVKRVRFKQIPDQFWDEALVKPAWERTKKAWTDLIARLREFGILSNDIMPTEAALVTLITLIEKFPHDRFEPALHWFLQASRFGRYSGSGTTSLEEDLREVDKAATQHNALEGLLTRVRMTGPLVSEDFMRDYADTRFGRFLLYLMVYRNKALDWDEKSHRVGFDGLQALADFRPQWHHIFPRRFLEEKVPDERIDALANIAVIGPSINIRISAKDPLDYIARYSIDRSKLAQQYIDGEVAGMTIANYEAWLDNRAANLAEQGNRFLDQLGAGGPA
jgi:hypothetical protein